MLILLLMFSSFAVCIVHRGESSDSALGYSPTNAGGNTPSMMLGDQSNSIMGMSFMSSSSNDPGDQDNRLARRGSMIGLAVSNGVNGGVTPRNQLSVNTACQLVAYIYEMKISEGQNAHEKALKHDKISFVEFAKYVRSR